MSVCHRLRHHCFPVSYFSALHHGISSRSLNVFSGDDKIALIEIVKKLDYAWKLLNPGYATRRSTDFFYLDGIAAS